MKLLADMTTDMAAILRHFDVSFSSRLNADLNCVIDGFKTATLLAEASAERGPDLGIQQAWSLLVDQGQSAIRSGHLLRALMSDELMRTTAATMFASSRRSRWKACGRTTRRSRRSRRGSRTVPAICLARGRAWPRQRAPPGENTPALDQYTIDLTAGPRR